MIKSFKDKSSEAIFRREPSKRLPVEIYRRALRKLLILDAAVTPGDLKIPPGNRLETLKGKRLGQFSIRINDQWRVCFIWKGGDAYEVEITDYHS